MGKVIAGIMTSIDGYYTGPDDGPGRGLGSGRRLFDGFERSLELEHLGVRQSRLPHSSPTGLSADETDGSTTTFYRGSRQ